ncbi:hypothetical protein ACHAW5_000298 [Stephanodiscus triporus]|uniref:Uncharacterized protein n=1 Tax=Stephanodiscus triporus TaxID=2934178 RepID=A0ABD3MLZ8_9STRA
MKSAVSPGSAFLRTLFTGWWLHSGWVAPTTALNGINRQTAFNSYPNWRSFEVVTQGDQIGGYTLPGQFDGIGAHLINNTHIRVLLNHETPWGCDTASMSSSVSDLTIDKTSLKSAINNMINKNSAAGVSFVKQAGKAYNKYWSKNGTSVESFGVHLPDEFGLGEGRGFVDTLYIFGEEEDATVGNGRFFAIANKTMHMITGAGTGDATIHQGGINGLGRDSLENAAQIDTVPIMENRDFVCTLVKRDTKRMVHHVVTALMTP